MIDLIPFGVTDQTRPWSLSVLPKRQSDRLSLRYQLIGPLELLELPVPCPPCRAHDLWTTTCFEFFIGRPVQTAYWEINLSPSGCWNVYTFDQYRAQMREEPALKTLQFETDQAQGQLTLNIDFDLVLLNLQNAALDLGVTTVLKTKTGEVSYWAIAHTGPEADFHRRDSFVCQL